MNTNSSTTTADAPPVAESVQDALQSTKQALAAGQQAIENIETMQQKMQRSLDWRVQVEENPWLALGVAAVGGLLLSTLFSGGGHSRSYRY